MTRPSQRLIVRYTLGIIATLTACDALAPKGDCTASVEPAIVVEITDARTGGPLARNAVGLVRDGNYVDSLRPYGFHSSDPATMYSRRAADERAGSYTVQLSVAGYQPWTALNVRVQDGGCHVSTRTLQARLQPQP